MRSDGSCRVGDRAGHRPTCAFDRAAMLVGSPVGRCLPLVLHPTPRSNARWDARPAPGSCPLRCEVRARFASDPPRRTRSAGLLLLPGHIPRRVRRRSPPHAAPLPALPRGRLPLRPAGEHAAPPPRPPLAPFMLCSPPHAISLGCVATRNPGRGGHAHAVPAFDKITDPKYRCFGGQSRRASQTSQVSLPARRSRCRE